MDGIQRIGTRVFWSAGCAYCTFWSGPAWQPPVSLHLIVLIGLQTGVEEFSA
jgi:hypothetical protein